MVAARIAAILLVACIFSFAPQVEANGPPACGDWGVGFFAAHAQCSEPSRCHPGFNTYNVAGFAWVLNNVDAEMSCVGLGVMVDCSGFQTCEDDESLSGAHAGMNCEADGIYSGLGSAAVGVAVVCWEVCHSACITASDVPPINPQSVSNLAEARPGDTVCLTGIPCFEVPRNSIVLAHDPVLAYTGSIRCSFVACHPGGAEVTWSDDGMSLKAASMESLSLATPALREDAIDAPVPVGMIRELDGLIVNPGLESPFEFFTRLQFDSYP